MRPASVRSVLPFLVLLSFSICAVGGWAAVAGEPAIETGPVVLDMDTVRHKPMKITTPDGAKADSGAVSLVDGKEGKACRFAFAASRGSTFMTAWVPATPAWDEAETKARVTLVNPALGGTTLSQNLVLMPRWLKGTPRPDLVTVWFGYNDWDSRVRGERFAEYLALAVDRIRRMTGGHADVLLMTTCPAFARWDTMGEMAEAVRRVAREKQTGLADVAATFHAAGSADAAKAKGYWVRDNTHLGAAGHTLACETVRNALR